MVEIEIQDDLLDCPRFGIIGELRCLASCKWFVSREEGHVKCKFDEETEKE